MIAFTFGIKIHNPIIAETMAVINTAAADKSLMCPAFSLYSGEMKSTRCSMDVLKISADRTIPVQRNSTNHSVVVT